ncbi:RING finger ubiquitin ligase [Trichosporon asahii var. asahii CBS 2479]|uniref:RING-type E3 ubiquitin transferase n=1 Tax=Trichosporon asahii var. asahii (strain ATCC 90039 / CBS 2479 / JCM 2466 / KCTC 7840 / NBRC 103889/ NCYC 2677 / UAMH 7654) TaxID=1186058 RepID=J8TSN6_TRIAS|nr:RING finger ubiquitin ligase [Trichosporon asahii var. asahii CBS 2479]EJT53239.1 RING finger ubiquitin ligase [Trichosporon asahii var. asahii CBS 2479]
MLILTMFFFLMGNGNSPQIINDDGTPRITELDIIREQVDEYEGYLNGTGNWTEPDHLNHAKAAAAEMPFFTNITGGYRQAEVEVIDLLSPTPAKGSTFFAHQRIPSLNQSWWNETNAAWLRGEFDWKGVSQWDMNLNERRVEAATNTTASGVPTAEDWNWVKGTVTLSGTQTIEYDVFGLHHVPNGTYELYGQPQHTRIDIRNIPRLYPDHHNTTARLIMAELKKELRFREHQLVTPDAKGDDPTTTTCPLLMYMSVPPLPPGVDPKEVEAYHKELAEPSGLLWSLPKPPQYWQNNGFGIVAIADQCGVALGVDKGRGVGVGDFNRKTINSPRAVAPRAPDGEHADAVNAGQDTWIFSAHLAIGIYSDNKTSLPLLVLAFLIFCTAFVFGPAPERAPQRDEDEDEPRGFFARISHAFYTHAPLRWIAGIAALLLLFQIILIPNVIPFILFIMHSTWVPQIWRNARRGSANALQHGFVLGTAAGRLALPLCEYSSQANLLTNDRRPCMPGQRLLHRQRAMDLAARAVAGRADSAPVRAGPFRARVLPPEAIPGRAGVRLSPDPRAAG